MGKSSFLSRMGAAPIGTRYLRYCAYFGFPAWSALLLAFAAIYAFELLHTDATTDLFPATFYTFFMLFFSFAGSMVLISAILILRLNSRAFSFFFGCFLTTLILYVVVLLTLFIANTNEFLYDDNILLYFIVFLITILPMFLNLLYLRRRRFLFMSSSLPKEEHSIPPAVDSIAFVAQNIAMIYDVFSLSDYCILPWDKLLYAVGLCDCISYLRTGRMQPSTIYNAVVCAKKREVRWPFDSRSWTWETIDKYTMLADFVIALEYQIFRADTDALPEDIIDILIEDQNRIRDEIASTLALGTKAPLYETVRTNVACWISAPSFESILQTFEDYSAKCLFEDQHLSPHTRG